MTTCCCCFSKEVVPLLDFGWQPICNRFLETPSAEEQHFSLGLSLCNFCGIITLTNPIPANELQPKVDWIRYTEAEVHLDDVVNHLVSEKIISSASILGLSSHDEPLLQRMRAKKFENSRPLSFQELNIDHNGAGIETIQTTIIPDWAEKFLHAHKKNEVIIARYLLEHVHNVASFLEAIQMLMQPGGYVLFEAPDFSTSLAKFDYSNIWEEHSFYFTPATFERLLNNHGFSVKKFLSYSYPLENAMVAICQMTKPKKTDQADLSEMRLARTYAAQFEQRRKQLHECLKRLQASGKIVIFGAGHLAIKFINLFDLSKFISFVVDDHPKKTGLYLPGSRLPVKPTSALLDEEICHCLLSLNPEREDKIINSLAPIFSRKGMTTYSIFSASAKKLPIYP